MKKIFKILFIFLAIFILSCAGFSVYAYVCISEIDKKIISGQNLLDNFSANLTFYDDEEKILDSTFSSGKIIAKLDDMPDYVKYAFISVEDKNFYKHNGLNLKRILKAFVTNIFSGYAKEGASTISQQLVKNIHLSNSKTLKRKIQEAYLTKKLEKQYTKDEILEAYLNVIYFGNNCIGIENASKKYFDCDAKNLTISQSATLAGIIKSPTYYSPTENPENCFERRNLVLLEMKKDGYITDEDYKKAKNSELGLNLQQNIIDNNPYFKNCLIEAENILNISEKDLALSGYKIYTWLQNSAQNNLINSCKSHFNTLNDFQSSIITILDNKTCGVVAMISPKSTNILRQPGSLIKPLLCYAPAFEEGILSPLTPIDDSEMNFENWTPKNADNDFDGYISVRQALYKSKNIPAIKTLSYVGIDKAKSYLNKMNFPFNDLDNHLALSLGSMKYGVSPIKMTAYYSTFANNGLYENCHFIKKIVDNFGKTIYECTSSKTKVFSEETTYLINDILKDCAKIGTAKRLSDLDFDVSAKTGTVGQENGNTDAWCISYNQNNTICAWTGNISGKAENNLKSTQNGGTICANLNKIAWQALGDKNMNWFVKPDGVIKTNIDLIDYNEKHLLNLATENTPNSYIVCDIFNKKFLPTEFSQNFKEISDITLSFDKTDEKLVFHWNFEDFLTYFLYADEKLIYEDCLPEISIDLPTKTTTYYVVAKNKYTNKEVKSNLQTVVIEKDNNSIFSKILSKW